MSGDGDAVENSPAIKRVLPAAPQPRYTRPGDAGFNGKRCRDRALQQNSHNQQMKLKSYLSLGACMTAVAVFIQGAAFAAPKKTETDATASPSPSPSAEASSAGKPARAVPFRGKISAVDTSASTFTIGGKKERVIKVTDKTTVTKDGAAATISDITAKEAVSGSYWKQSDGTLEAKKVRIGAKGMGKKSRSKKAKKDGAESDTAAESQPVPSPSPAESPGEN